MVLDVLAGAILVAFGFFVTYFALESEKGDRGFVATLAIGIVLVLIGGWIILSSIELATILKKLGGLVLAVVGIFLLTGFPDIVDYQPKAMTKGALFVGLVLLIVGVYIFLF